MEEKEENGHHHHQERGGERGTAETELFLQWGSRKRLRCVRVRGAAPEFSDQHLASTTSRIRRKISSRFVTLTPKETSIPFPQPTTTTRLTRNSESAATLRSENRRASAGSPEKEERCYATRGSVDENGNNQHQQGVDEHHRNNNINHNNHHQNHGNNNNNESRGGVVWPKLYITLSSKEKEEDFMAMKGCKLPQRPKKRAKVIQRTLLLVSPGAWLTDMSLERYEVREKKTSKKRPRGLKAMGSLDSDSE